MATNLDPNSAAFTAAAEAIAKAAAANARNGFGHGRYKLMITECVLQSGHQGISFKAEHKVVESAPLLAGHEPSLPGASGAFVVNMTTNKYGAGNIVQYLFAVAGQKEQAMPEAEKLLMIRNACGAAQPMRGYYVNLETVMKALTTPDKRTGQMFAIYPNNWTCVPNQTDAEVAARRAALAMG